MRQVRQFHGAFDQRMAGKNLFEQRRTGARPPNNEDGRSVLRPPAQPRGNKLSRILLLAAPHVLGALVRAEQRGQEHAAAAATAQAESAVLRDAVARAELENAEAGTVAEAICAEIASSRIALAGAAREAQDRAAAGDAMRAEI
jgi:hypothetical protein